MLDWLMENVYEEIELFYNWQIYGIFWYYKFFFIIEIGYNYIGYYDIIYLI